MTAVVVVSESELAKVIPNWETEASTENPDWFTSLLYGMGIDTSKPVERQDDLIHRNNFGKVVQCTRWVGVERLDKEWISSPYASREAKNEASGSKMVRDLDPHKYHDL